MALKMGSLQKLGAIFKASMRRQGEGGGSKNANIEATLFMDGP